MSPWIVSTLAMGFAIGGAGVWATVVARGSSSASAHTAARARMENGDLCMKPPERLLDVLLNNCELRTASGKACDADAADLKGKTARKRQLQKTLGTATPYMEVELRQQPCAFIESGSKSPRSCR